MWFKRIVKFIKGYFNGSEVISRDIMEQMNYDEECKDNRIEHLEEQVKIYEQSLELYKEALKRANKYHISYR